jgi:hypothetical protein
MELVRVVRTQRRCHRVIRESGNGMFTIYLYTEAILAVIHLASMFMMPPMSATWRA